ncbi:Yip1 domain protein, partial [Ichthyophthirius multifiliis]
DLGINLQQKLQSQIAQIAMNRILNQQNEQQQQQQSYIYDNQYQQQENEGFCESLFKRFCFFFDIKSYKPYFEEVTTSAVIKRLAYSLNPLKSDFFKVSENKPDFYGPIWISFTLIFTFTAIGNLSLYLQSADKSKFEYQFSFIPKAFVLVCGYAIIIPIFVAFLMQLFGSLKIYYSKISCIYGYSLFVFIPISIICVIPNNYLQIILFSYGAINSTLFLINNF